MKSITLKADDHLIDTAHRLAADERTTISAKFREWLEDYISRAESTEETVKRRKWQAERAIATIKELRRRHPPQDRKFTREEMNEHR